jgi:hypothetical protein
MKYYVLLAAGMLFMAACAGPANTPGSAVENYYKTLVTKNESKTASLACAAWEGDARRDSKAFADFPASADNIQCHKSGQDGNFTIVACTGQLTLDYNGDKQQVDLAAREYRVTLEGGAWKMCGYK